MSVDISRVLFDRSKHYSQLVHQQGRVTLDADANEQTACLLHYMRTVVSDVLGPAASPANGGGFAITPIAEEGQPRDLGISAGRLYVDGLLLENEADTTYLTQPDGYLDAGAEGDRLPDFTDAAMVPYLRVWEREVTAIQDPSIREVALGDHGPDTAARAKTVWQVAVHQLEGTPGKNKGAQAFKDWLAGLHAAPGLLAAQAKPDGPAVVDPCRIAPDARYRGPENQLYRVQIHTSGEGRANTNGPGTTKTAATKTAAARPGARTAARKTTTSKAAAKAAADQSAPVASFVWSRENASVAFPVLAVAGPIVTLAEWGRDASLGLELGDWVELIDDRTAMRETDEVPVYAPQRIHQVVGLDVLGRTVTLDADPNEQSSSGGLPRIVVSGDRALYPFLRRWDHRPPPGSDALEVVLDTWIPLEDGVQVMFSNPQTSAQGARAGWFRRGDFWTVPARTITGDVIWPNDGSGPVAQAPQGVVYRYAPLAYVEDGNAVLLVPTFSPLFP
jgi:hypothetical protein